MSQDVSLTELIQRVGAGDQAALRELFDVTYAELRLMARNRLRPMERHGMLNTTALVHECFLRFSLAKRLGIEDRTHFYRYAGKAMRSVIVDLAHASLTARRGGSAPHQSLSTTLADAIPAGEDEVLRVHEALDELANYDGRLVQVVEMRYFAGMNEVEIAEALGVTERTVRRDWQKARLLLAKALAV